MDVVVNYADDRVDARVTTGRITVLPITSFEKSATHLYPLYDAYDTNRKQVKTIQLERIGMYEIIIHIVTPHANIASIIDITLLPSKLTASSSEQKKKIQTDRIDPRLSFWHRVWVEWLVLEPPCDVRLMIKNNGQEDVECTVFIEIHYRS